MGTGLHLKKEKIEHYVLYITKPRLFNFDPIKPHFYIVKLGFTRVYIIFLISAQNIDCGYALEPPRRGGSNEYPQSMFWTDIWKISRVFYLKIFRFWRWIFLCIWIGVLSLCKPAHDQTYNQTCATSEDSDQPVPHTDQSLRWSQEEKNKNPGWMYRLIWVLAATQVLL